MWSSQSPFALKFGAFEDEASGIEDTSAYVHKYNVFSPLAFPLSFSSPGYRRSIAIRRRFPALLTLCGGLNIVSWSIDGVPGLVE